jgi:poly-gamma-glutamate synthesis protein (capsule biosynthesis protein)
MVGAVYSYESRPMSPTRQAQKERISVVLGGDVLVRNGLAELFQKRGSAFLFSELRSVLEKADVVFANLECPLTTAEDRNASKDPTLPFLKAPVTLAEALAKAPISVVSLANNHTMDFGERGLRDTMDALRGAGVAWVGAGLDETAARTAVIRKVKGWRIGFLAYAASDYAGKSTPGCAPAREDVMLRDVKRLRAECDRLFVSVHQGVVYSDIPVGDHVRMYRKLVDAGADVVFGHHPHVTQGFERRGDGWIFYSLGSIIFDLTRAEEADELRNCTLCRAGAFAYSVEDRRSREGLLVHVTISHNALTMETIPVFQECLDIPRIATGSERQSLLERMERISAMIDDPPPDYSRTLESLFAGENLNGFRSARAADILLKLHRLRWRHVRYLLNAWQSRS